MRVGRGWSRMKKRTRNNKEGSFVIAKLTLRLWRSPPDFSPPLDSFLSLPPSFFGATTFLSFSSGFPPVSWSATLLGKPCLNAQTKREIKGAAARAR